MHEKNQPLFPIRKKYIIDRYKRDILYRSVTHGSVKTAQRILETGVGGHNIVNNNDVSILYIAATQGNIRMVQLLLTYGFQGPTALHAAAYKGYVEIVKLLLNYRVDINHVDKSGYTALYPAAHAGHTEIVKLLLIHGARDPLALHIAAYKGYVEIVKLLLNYGADISHKDKSGYTAVDCAIQAKEIAETRLNL